MVTTLPAGDTFYTFEAIGEPLRDQQYSNVSVRIPVQDTSGSTIATLWLSDGPAYGASILSRVALAWGIASLAAVLLAAAAGWAISRRLTAPLLALTDVTQSMAEGDLTVRADTLPEVEFNELARSFNQMASRVEAMVLALRRFVSDASHELQTPLTALRTNLDLAVSELDPAIQKTYLERALGQVERLHQLATGLLDLSRMEAGLNHHEPAPVDLRQMVSELSEVYAAQAEQAGKEFSLLAPEHMVLVLGNEGQLRQAVGNLIDNALKFTPPGGSIVVGLDSSEDQIRVSVEDTGIGVPAEDLDQLFKRFHRGRNAAAYPGSGLGLAIVQTIAEAHQGGVTAENRSTGGAKFTLQLPR
jgi:signal transduction histidine kinase